MLENYLNGKYTKDGEVLLILASGEEETVFIENWMKKHGHELLNREVGKPGHEQETPRYAIYTKVSKSELNAEVV
jgi:hypothetical protein